MFFLPSRFFRVPAALLAAGVLLPGLASAEAADTNDAVSVEQSAGPSLAAPAAGETAPNSEAGAEAGAGAADETEKAIGGTPAPPSEGGATNATANPGPAGGPASDSEAPAVGGKAAGPDAGATADGGTPGGTVTETDETPAASLIRFEFSEMPYRDVVQRFAQITGKPLIADVQLEGSLTFSDPQPYEYGEALDTLNLILAGKKAMLLETGRYLRLIPFDDLQKLPLPIFRGVEEAEGVRAGEVVTVVLQLQNLDASEISESITGMLTRAGSVAPLSRGRGLIVTDRVENIRRVRDLLAQIDASAPKQRQMRIHPLKNASGTLLADLVNRTFGVATAPKKTVFNQQRKAWDVLPADPEDYITAIFAEASNTLVLFGPAERMVMSEELITRFETETGARASEVKVYYPQMKAEELAQMVREAIPGIASPRDNSKEAGIKARVISDTASNRLVVTAPASGQLDAIEKLIHQLDPTTQEVPQEDQGGEKRELRIIELQTVSSSELVPILRDAFAEQVRNEKGADFTSRARILPDPSGGRVLLSGLPEELDQIATLIQQLDAGEADSGQIRVFKLKAANARNVAAMIMGAMGGDTRRYDYRRSGGLQRPGGVPARAIADDRSNTVIVMASPEQMRLIEEVIRKIEEEGDTEGRQLRLVKLEHNSATSVVAMLSQLFYAQIRGYDREKRIAVTAAADDRTVALEADAETMKQLEAFVKELDVEPAGSGLEVRTYAVPEGRVNDISATLSRLFEAQRGSRERREPTARFEADSTSDTLIVAATAEQFTEIEALLEKLRTAVSTATQMRTFHLKHARADQVVSVLENMLGSGSGGSRDWYNYMRNRGGSGGGNEFKVTSAPALNAVVIQAAPQKLALATQLIQTLDVPESSAASTVQTVALKRASPEEVASALSRMLSPRDYREQPSNVRVSAVSGSKMVLVSGPEAEVKRVVELITEMDSTGGEAGQILKVYHLQHAEAGEVIEVLQSALDAVSSSSRSYYYSYRSRGGGQTDDSIKVSAARGLNAVVVQATKEKQAQAEELIKLLDVEDAGGADVLRTVQLKQANADELAMAVTQILSPYDYRGEPPAVRVTPVSASKTLLVKGPETEVERVVTLIEQLDATSGTAGQVTKVYQLRYADAREVVSVLESTLSSTGGSSRSYYYSYRYRGGGGSSDEVRVTAAEGLNSVVVQASSEKQKQAEDLIKLLDVEDTDGADVLRTVQLKQANADELAVAITQILSPAGYRGEPPAVRVTPVSASKTLLVKGPETEVERVVTLVEQLDATSGTAGQVTKVYQLRYADAREVVSVLESTLSSTGGSSRSYYYSYRYRGGGGGTGDDVRVTAAEGLNSVVVQATEEKQKQAEQLITLLDVEQAGEAGSIQTVRLERATADGVAQAVNQALQPADRNGTPASVRVTAVQVAKSVLVTGPPTEVTKVVELIKGLDVTSGEAGVETRVYRLEHAEARQVADVLENTMGSGSSSNPYTFYSRYRGSSSSEEEFKVTAASALNAVVVQAGAAKQEQAASLIKALDVEQSAEAGLVRAIQLEKADANSVAMAVNEALSPRDWRSGSPTVRATAVSGTKMVLINGPPAEVEKVVELVKNLDQTGGDAGLETQVYVLQHASAAQVVEVLQTTLGSSSSSSRNFSYYSYRYRPSSSESEFKVTAASGVNAVIVQATPFKQTAAADLIEKLDTPELAGAAQVRAVVLRKAQPEAVAEAVNDSLAPEGRNGQAPAVRATPVLGTRTVLVKGPPAEVERVMALIAQLDETGSGGGTETRVYQLRNGDATDLSRTLQQLLSGMGRSQSRWSSRYSSTTFTVAADERTNSIIVSATPDAFGVVEQLLPMLDRLPERADREIQFYWLVSADAFDVADKLDTIFSDRPEKEQPVIEADIFSNSLTVVANPVDLLVIEDVIDRLDVGAQETTLQVRLITLGSVPADKMTAMLTNIYPQMSPTRIRVMERLPTPVVVPETPVPDTRSSGSTNVRSKPLTAPSGAALPATHKTPAVATGVPGTVAPAVVPPPSTTPPPPATVPPGTPSPLGSTLVVPPANTNAVGAVAAVLAQRPDVFLAYDAEANAIIVSGPPLELDQIQDIIDSLTSSFSDADTEIRQFPLQEADPVAVAKVLTELFKAPQPPQQQGDRQPPQTENGRPVPDRGDAEQRDRGREAQGQGQGNRNQQGNRGQQPQQPRVAVVAEPRTRSVIVRASPADMPLMESVIQQLDAPGVSSQLEHRSIPLEYARPDKLLPLVQQMVEQLKEVQPADPVAVGADLRRRAIFVVGRGPVIERLVTMIQELDAPSDFAEIELRVFALKNATAASLAALLRDMLQPASGTARELSDDARTLLEQVQRLKLTDDTDQPVTLDLTKPVKIIADPAQANAAAGAAQRLILGSTPQNLAALVGVVELLDTVPIVEGLTARIVRLKYVDADVVLETLNSIFQQGGRDDRSRRPRGGGTNGDERPRPPDTGAAGGSALSQTPNIALDARNNALILSGLPESIALAEAIIQDLDREMEAMVTEVRLFKLEHALPSGLVTPLRAVFTEGTGRGGGTRGLSEQISRLRLFMGGEIAQLSENATARAAVTIQADDPSSTLIVAARSDLMPLIAEVIRTLDVPPAGSFDTLRVFALEHADAASVERVLTDLARNRSRATTRPEDVPSISVDERTNALVASGSDAALAFLERLVNELDRELPADLQNVKLIPLENADAGTVATSLQRLMDERSGVSRRGGGGRSPGVSSLQRVVIIPDERTNTLLVGAAPEGFALVELLAKQLDQAGPSLTGQVRLIPLEHATAQTLSTTLTALFNQRYQALRSPEMQRNRPVILPDPRSNSLLVVAGVEDNRAIDDLLVKLDRQPDNPALELTVIGLQVNDAARVATTLRGVFAARLQALTTPGQSPAPAERVDVQADSLSNALIVSASKENLLLMKDLIAKLDVEPVAADGVIQTFTLTHADVQRVAAMLRSLIDQGVYRPGVSTGPGGRGGANTGRDALAVTADAGSNTLIVSASPENLVVVKELITRLDTPEFTEVSDIRTFTLKHARASYLATVLEQFFRAKRQGESTAQGAQRSVPVTVTADDRSNTLLITGGKESFGVVERMIQQLDTEDAVAKTNFRVFPLKQATAAKLAGTLQRLFTGRPTRAGVAPDPVSVIADTWANALIIGAADDDMAMIESLLERLDSATDEAGLQVRVFSLAKADARRVATTLESLFRGASVGVPGAGAAVSVNVDERLNAVIVSAGEADLNRVGELVKQLDTDQVARIAEIRVFPLVNARAAPLALILNDVLNTNPQALGDENPNRQSLLQFIGRRERGDDFIASALKEGVLIVPDSRINALVVSAPVDYIMLLEEVVNHLDTSAPQIAQIKVFNLKNADARQMALVLTSLFRLEDVGPADANARSVQYTLVRPAEVGGEAQPATVGAVVNSAEEHALTVTVDLRTNSLLVGGTEHYVGLASEIIQTLDSSPAQERQTAVYRLRNTRARDVEIPLRTFLQQDLERMTTVLGPNAVGTAQNLLEREVSIVAETNSNTLLLSASPRYFTEVEALIEELDQPQSQVLIQVLLAEVNLDSTTELGVEWSYAGSGDPSFSTGTDFMIEEALRSFGGYYAALSGGDVQVLLRALQVDGRLEILSRPQILTADNMEATINIGQRIPLVTDSSVTPQGGTINQFSYEDVGVILTVTPRISPDGFVRLDVGPTISSLSSSSVQVSPGLDVPIINQRTATTTVAVRSGESVLIGGLIGSTEDTRTRKVPLLGDIPLLGNLFRSKKATKGRTELLIVLTPQILTKGTGAGTSIDAVSYSQREILNSDLLTQPERDPIQARILRELHPDYRSGLSTNQPSNVFTNRNSVLADP